jgi:hypothetical protein
MAVVIRQAIADSATSRTTQAGTHGTAGSAADAATDYLAACGAKPTANRGFGFLAILRAHRATGRAPDTGADRSAGTTANRLADDTAQGTTQATTYGGGGCFPGKNAWCNGQGQC